MTSGFSPFIFSLVITLALSSCRTHSNDDPASATQEAAVRHLPPRENVWVFMLAGQSNMAGRGKIAAGDTVTSARVLTIDKEGNLIRAREPIHFYEPAMAGLDCGLSFGKAMIANLPDSISVLLIPTAVGGSSSSQWLGDSTHRNVKLLSNFRSKVDIARNHGTLKGVLWHQGESDANPTALPGFSARLSALFARFRTVAMNDTLPIFIGELAPFPKNSSNREKINQRLREYASTDRFTAIIQTADLNHKGDSLHFDAEGQRKMGERFATAFLARFK